VNLSWTGLDAGKKSLGTILYQQGATTHATTFVRVNGQTWTGTRPVGGRREAARTRKVVRSASSSRSRSRGSPPARCTASSPSATR
jgi:hypothetical protein